MQLVYALTIYKLCLQRRWTGLRCNGQWETELRQEEVSNNYPYQQGMEGPRRDKNNLSLPQHFNLPPTIQNHKQLLTKLATSTLTNHPSRCHEPTSPSRSRMLKTTTFLRSLPPSSSSQFAFNSPFPRKKKSKRIPEPYLCPRPQISSGVTETTIFRLYVPFGPPLLRSFPKNECQEDPVGQSKMEIISRKKEYTGDLSQRHDDRGTGAHALAFFFRGGSSFFFSHFFFRCAIFLFRLSG